MQLSLLEPPPTTRIIHRSQGNHLTREDLQSYIPEQAIDYILSWFEKNPVRLRIAPTRSSKFGDYRAPKPGTPATISVNNNLNSYDFLITLVHEMAHDAVLATGSTENYFLFRRKKNRPKPHGKEWKSNYFELMSPLLNRQVFPEEILHALEGYFGKVTASAKASQTLAVALKNYDAPDGKVFLQDLPYDEIFYIPGGKAFQKKERIRKRFRCQSLNNRRVYLFSPLALVSKNKIQ
jgi:SprT protein